MWGTLTLSCLLGLFKTGAPQDVTTISPTVTTMPGSDGTMTSPVDNKMCINPKQFVEDNITAATRDLLYENIHLMRGWTLQEMIPLSVPGCGIFGEGTNLSLSYVEGPWDPVFQLYWGHSGHAGCAMTKYKNSDTAAMSKIFHMEINETQELWNIVCVFRPAGCVAGAEAWNQCPETSPTPSTPEPTDPETSNPTPSNPTNPNPTNPNPTPPPPTTRQPQSTGKRIGQRMGFNFESLTILVAAALSRNLVHMLNPSFI
uniref:Protein piccolo n=1 Tax=Lygus hesperus TaxID=30085 RepID=A0A0A9W1F4_LYGHE